MSPEIEIDTMGEHFDNPRKMLVSVEPQFITFAEADRFEVKLRTDGLRWDYSDFNVFESPVFDGGGRSVTYHRFVIRNDDGVFQLTTYTDERERLQELLHQAAR